MKTVVNVINKILYVTIFVMLLYVLFQSKWFEIIEITSVPTANNFPAGEITKLKPFQQSIVLEGEEDEIHVLFATFARNNTGFCQIKLEDEYGIVYLDRRFDISQVEDNTFKSFQLSKKIIKGKYNLIIESLDGEEGNSITVWVNGNINGQYRFGANVSKGSIIYSTTKKMFRYDIFMVAIILLVALFLLLSYGHIKNSNLLKKTGIVKFDNIFVYISIFVVICGIFIFKINFSSFFSYQQYFKKEIQDFSRFTIGQHRNVRSDEYMVITPLQINQVEKQYDKNNLFTEALGERLNVNILGAEIPAFDFSSLAKIFNWGFLMFGGSIGLSWYYIIRLVLLIIFSYYMLYINAQNKILSAVFSFCVSFSPQIQWWLTAQPNIMETFIAGQMILVSLVYIFSKEIGLKYKILNSVVLFAGIVILGFSLYVPGVLGMAYFCLFFLIGYYLEHREVINENLNKNWMFAVVPIGVALMIAGFETYRLFPDIIRVIDTTYPGKRINPGGQYEKGSLVYYLINVFLPFKAPLVSNQTEIATFFTLFPIPLIIYWSKYKEYKKSYLIRLLIAYIVIFLFYFTVGFPDILNRVMFMTRTTPRFLYFVFYAMQYLIFLWIDKNNKISLEKDKVIKIMVMYFLFLYFVYKKMELFKIYPFGGGTIALLIVLFCYLAYNLLIKNTLFLKGLVFLTVISGMTVNPINFGIDFLNKTELAQKIQEINLEQDFTWTYLNDKKLDTLFGKYLLFQGAKTFGIYNFPPNLEQFKLLDSSGEYEDIYNRASHIILTIVPERQSIEERFKLLSTDLVNVFIKESELKKLRVDYALSKEKIDFLELVYTDMNGNNIYKIN